MTMNFSSANVLVICATVLQASGPAGTAPAVLDSTTHADAYAIYATELSQLWAQSTPPLMLQQETERGFAGRDQCALLKNQTGDWAEAAKDFDLQNARVWLLQPAMPNGIQYRLVRRFEMDAQEAQVPGTYPGRAGLAQYAAVSAVGFNHDRTKAIVHVHLRMSGRIVKLERIDGTWRPVDESCSWAA